MKQSQLIAGVVALAGLVFVVTFAMNYIGPGARDPGSGGAKDLRPALSLTFPQKVLPPDQQAEAPKGPGQPAQQPRPDFLVCETHKPAHQDYWFRNDNDQPVTVGLQKKSCTCSSVRLFIPSEGEQQKFSACWPEILVPLLIGQVAGAGWEGGVSGLAGWGARVERLQSAVEGKELFERDSVQVPPGTRGWVRLGWKREQAGPQSLTGTLWMDRADNTVQLEARVVSYEPVRLRREIAAGPLNEEELPRTVYIHVWSSTREELPHLKAEAVSSRDRAADPLVVGAPVRMTPAETRELERLNSGEFARGEGDLTGRVTCGYKIPVTLSKVSPDGSTPFDLGSFRRWVLVHTGETPEPVSVSIVGQVRGEVSVESEEGGVYLSSFPASKGARATLTLQTESPALKLEFDRHATASYLSASFVGEPQDAGSGRKLWKLRVEVLPGKASGQFPRREDPAYRDSAVYLKVVQPGKQPRSIRIPVGGTANAG